MGAGCFTLVLLLLLRRCLCSVSLPCSAVGWSVVVAFPGPEVIKLFHAQLS